ncbi:unnamed protein product [Effrenium voratum]|nr:unnamed protein product [Effrenium voratum]
MLRFAQLGPQEEDGEHDAGLDRAQLRKDYEAALARLGASDFAAASAALRRLVALQAAPTTRDSSWLQAFQSLCFRNLALCFRAQNAHAEALQHLQNALKYAPQDRRSSLWRQLADCAVAAEDWRTAVQALGQCLRFWPHEPLLLRSYAQCALRLGDLPRSEKALESLTSREGCEDRDKWLQMRLKRRFELPWYKKDSTVSAEEAQLRAVNLARAKRRRRFAARTSPAEAQRLMRLTFVELLQTLRAMVARAVPPFQPVYFFFAQEESEIQEVGEENEDSMTKSLLDCFRALLVQPWPRGGSASRWLLQALSSPALSSMEESETVAAFLGLKETHSGNIMSFRSWLFAALNFTAERWQDILRVSMDLCQLTALQVQKETPSSILFQVLGDLPSSAGTTKKLFATEESSGGTWHIFKSPQWSSLRGFWAWSPSCGGHVRDAGLLGHVAHSAFLTWVERPLAEGEDAEPRIVLRDFVRQHGLQLAEACMASKRLPWLVQPGRSLLRAWLYWHPQLGTNLSHRSWIEEGLGFENGFQVDEAEMVREISRHGNAAAGDALRCLHAGAALRQVRLQELPLLRCRALLSSGSGVGGVALSVQQLDTRLQQVRQVLNEARQGSEAVNDEVQVETQGSEDTRGSEKTAAPLEDTVRQATARLAMLSPTETVEQAEAHAFETAQALRDQLKVIFDWAESPGS